MFSRTDLDLIVSDNFKKVKLWYLIPPILIILMGGIYLFMTSVESFNLNYVNCQKGLFFYLNKNLAQFPHLQHNLTQLGDVLIFFSLLTILFIYAPKFWEVLIISSILSLFISVGLKELFDMPRPAAVFHPDDLIIIGKRLTGNTSMPSGHSIITFVVISNLLFAFMPKRKLDKILWIICFPILGLFIAFSRVGVGAHFPLDVVFGSILGFMVVVSSILLYDKLKWFTWIKNLKFYPIFILIFIVLEGLIISKIIENSLPIFYLSLIVLTISIYLMTKLYVQRKN